VTRISGHAPPRRRGAANAQGGACPRGGQGAWSPGFPGGNPSAAP
jgi:hypothetical protein